MLDHFANAIVLSDNESFDAMEVDEPEDMMAPPEVLEINDDAQFRDESVPQPYGSIDHLHAGDAPSIALQNNPLGVPQTPHESESGGAQEFPSVYTRLDLLPMQSSSFGNTLRDPTGRLDLLKASQVRKNDTRKRPVEVVVLSDSEEDTPGLSLRHGTFLERAGKTQSPLPLPSANTHNPSALLNRPNGAQALRQGSGTGNLTPVMAGNADPMDQSLFSWDRSKQSNSRQNGVVSLESLATPDTGLHSTNEDSLTEVSDLTKLITYHPTPEVAQIESDDELEEVSKEVAEKAATFKLTSFNLTYQDLYYNKPIPVYHAGAYNPNSRLEVRIEPRIPTATQLQDKYNELKRYIETQTNERYRLVDLYGQLKADIDARLAAELDPGQVLIDRINQTSHKIHGLDKGLQDLKNEEHTLVNSIQRMIYENQYITPIAAKPNNQPSLHMNPYAKPNEDETHLIELFKGAFSDTNTDDMAETPDLLAIKLLDHQKQGLFWLLKKEEKNIGCLLADDMGLGKTVQTIALVMAHRPKFDEPNTTLIVGPVSLLRQWQAEFESKLKPTHTLKTILYHNTYKKKLDTFKRLSKYDIVFVSYTTLANEYKKHFGLSVEKVNDIDEDEDQTNYTSPFYSPSAKFFRIVLDEAHYIKNKDSQASKSVARLKAVHRMCLTGTPMQNKISELWPVLRFLRTKPYDDLGKFMTQIAGPLLPKNESFDDYELNAAMKRLRALLTAIMLRRTKTSTIDGKPLIVLPDKTIEQVFVEMTEAEKEYYTSMETSIQNTARTMLNDTASRTGFVGILALLIRLRQACIHKFLVEVGELRAAHKHASLKQTLETNYRMVKSMPRDLRSQISISLRPKIQEVKPLKKEGRGSRAKIKKALPLEDHLNRLDMLLHEDENVKKIAGQTDEEYVYESVSDSENDSGLDDVQLTCPLCFDVVGEDQIVIFLGCGHMICSDCVNNFLEGNGAVYGMVQGSLATQCMTCQAAVSKNQLVPYTIFEKITQERLTSNELVESLLSTRTDTYEEKYRALIKTQDFYQSAKVRKVLEILRLVFAASATDKIIIFSNFTVTFDMLKVVFRAGNIPFLRYDGTMGVDEKNATIEKFYQGSERVLLISLRAGNVGLTLTCASHVILMDPFWNPYVEEQAMDRAHRLGQLQKVTVYRILTMDSVEKRIMELQERKKELIGAALDENALKSSSTLGRNELGYLFGLNTLDGVRS